MNEFEPASNATRMNGVQVFDSLEADLKTRGVVMAATWRRDRTLRTSRNGFLYGELRIAMDS